MTFRRLLAIVLVLAVATVAWLSLGRSLVVRSGSSDARLEAEVTRLWGGPHVQRAPTAWLIEPPKRQEIEGKEPVERLLPLAGSDLDVDLRLDHRKKGLLWFDTYTVGFRARYRVPVPVGSRGPLAVHFDFPSTDALYDGFRFTVDGRPASPAYDLEHGVTMCVPAHPGKDTIVEIAYRSRGLDTWTYAFVPSGVAQVRDFRLQMVTDFHSVDFPAGTLSPTRRDRAARGERLTWRFGSLVTGQRLGIDLPSLPNPGPLAARITYFAPVSLLFFVAVLVVLGILTGESLHPMSYVFLAAAFFAFHLLLAYLVDHLDIHLAFLIAAGASLFLVVSYLRLVSGMRFALARAGLAQLVYLVLFSYAFFFRGYTGLTVTIGAVLTLFVLMQATGRVDWNEVFAEGEAAGP